MLGETDDTLLSYLYRNAEQAPDQVAVDCGNGDLYTYEYLIVLIQQFAAILKATIALSKDTVIALMVDEGIPQVISQLGVKQAGCIFTLLDLNTPEHKVRSLSTSVGAAAIISMNPLPYLTDDCEALTNVTYLSLTTTTCPPDVICSTKDIPCQNQEDICYIQHTSGSSGLPKPCPCRESSIVQYAKNRCADEEIGPLSRVLSASNAVFDPSQGDLASVLVSCGTLVSPGRQFLLHEISDIMATSLVTHICTTPSMLSLVSTDMEYVLKVISVGGEQSTKTLVANWLRYRKGAIRVINVYGITEECVYQSRHEFKLGDDLNVSCIGTPYSSHTFTIDSNGILHINGTSTGDICSCVDNEFVIRGRSDFQLKLNGVRIAPEEVEICIGSHPLVSKSVVYRSNGQLAAAVEFNDSCPPSVTNPALLPAIASLLRSFLKKLLQPILVPTKFVIYSSVSSLPVGRTGKIDRSKIKEREPSANETDDANIGHELQTPLQELVASVWSSVLGLNTSLNQHSDWNLLGGTSLSSVIAVRKLRFLVQGGGGGANWPAHKTTEANGDASLYIHTSGLFTTPSSNSGIPSSSPLLVGGDAECFMGMCDGGPFAPCKLSELGTIQQYADFLHSSGVTVPHTSVSGDGESVRDVHKQIFARFNQKELLRSLLQEEATDNNVGQHDNRKKRVTPLHIAAGEGHIDVVEMLVNTFNMSATATTGRGGMAAHFAAAAGKYEVLKFILNHTPPAARDKSGQTVLHYAVRSGQKSCVELVLEATGGHLIDSRDNQFRSPLHWAVLHSHVQIVDILVKSGARTDYPPIAPTKSCRKTRTAIYAPLEIAVQQLIKQQYNTNYRDCITILVTLIDNKALLSPPSTEFTPGETNQAAVLLENHGYSFHSAALRNYRSQIK
eukprot:TRINITY_DN8934_c0_g1_i1.p1 TRINITY_DN8934_c0_g1~~TRINITY_DN8934_c0_g1_i1.p1  ORF type:complete len:899 (+),score=146.59 TRINITY_DN8934_c0_g1_i1:30-2726(+)